MPATVLIAGCGDVGLRAGHRLQQHGFAVAGLRRRAGPIAAGIEALAADVTRPQSLVALRGRAFDYVVVATSAGEYSDERYRAVYVDGLANLLDALATPLRRLVLLSSTSVYHQRDGECVDEESATIPAGFAGQRQLEAEALAADCAAPATVLRCSGIYGPGRLRMIRQVRTHGVVADSRITNRIHSEDCAGVIAWLIARDQAGESIAARYLVSDCEPAPLTEVQRFIADRLGIEPTTAPSASGRRAGSKRCSNRRLLAGGYRFEYPGYRDGYGALIDALTTS